MLRLADDWVWDFWLADDGDLHHVFFLHAPRSLGDQRLRHRAASIGHAVSRDLSSWTVLPDVFGAGGAGDFDETATWTGCVVRGDDGLWRMFYTGARFLAGAPDTTNVEAVGLATSADLHHWVKQPGPVTSADPTWYETLGTSTWPEEAWRDPWVYRDAGTGRWQMLVTARSNQGPDDDRGVIGLAVSDDLATWTVAPPMTVPGRGFQHMEVPQLVHAPDGRRVLIFSCSQTALSDRARAVGTEGGVWAAPVAPDGTVGPIRRIAPESFYAGRVTYTRDGTAVLMAVVNEDAAGDFIGELSDPMALHFDAQGVPHVGELLRAR